MNRDRWEDRHTDSERESVINLSLYYHTHLFIDSIVFPYLSHSTDYDRD